MAGLYRWVDDKFVFSWIQFFTIDLGRNAIVVVMSACIAYALSSQGKKDVFSLVKKLPEGIPPVKVPTINGEVAKVVISASYNIILFKQDFV